MANYFLYSQINEHAESSHPRTLSRGWWGEGWGPQ